VSYSSSSSSDHSSSDSGESLEEEKQKIVLDVTFWSKNIMLIL
jgi:hypothetical protein